MQVTNRQNTSIQPQKVSFGSKSMWRITQLALTPNGDKLYIKKTQEYLAPKIKGIILGNSEKWNSVGATVEKYINIPKCLQKITRAVFKIM